VTLAALDAQPRPVLSEITVLIPTLGREILEESLYCIAAGSAWPGGVIVVDQGQNPQVADWMETLRQAGIDAEYIPSSERGRAAGVNRGLASVRTQFVAITDDDCFVEGEWLERMVERLEENPEAIVTGRVEAGCEEVIVAVTSRTPAVYRRPRLRFDAMSGGNVATCMTVVDRVGLFDPDPRLRTAEDGEWAYRALRAGVPIIYAPEAAVRHMGWRDGSARAEQYKDYARSHGGFYGKYLRKGDWFIALRAVVHHLRALRRWVRGAVTGDREAACLGRAYLTGMLPGIVAGLRKGGSV
jgi:GT2 family glycosyltransferase